MNQLPESKNELLSSIVLDREIEHVRDIGVDKEYGIEVSGSILHEREEVRVLGSVVLNSEGEPAVNHEETSYHAYPDGLTEEEMELLAGDQAVEATEELCRHNGISEPFIKEGKADISEDAR